MKWLHVRGGCLQGRTKIALLADGARCARAESSGCTEGAGDGCAEGDGAEAEDGRHGGGGFGLGWWFEDWVRLWQVDVVNVRRSKW
jgi:hypothetical protein